MTEENGRPLGEWLRQRREELGISLEHAEADTRIRIRYLEALETEDFDSLPDPVVGRGFLRNYAAYLELEVREASQRFTRLVAPPEPEAVPADGAPPFTEPFRPVPLHKMPGFRARRGWLAIAAGVLVVALVAAAWWGYPYLVNLWAWAVAQPQPTLTLAAVNTAPPAATRTSSPVTTQSATEPPAALEVTPADASATLELSPTPTRTPSPSPSPSPPVYTGIFLELVFTDTSWVQVTVDDVRQFQGELEEDTYRSWYGEDRIELRIGNAGAVLVTVNGESLGALGASGEVMDRVFEKVGDEVSEATVTVTPGAQATTPVATATAVASPTSSTPEASPTSQAAEASPEQTATATPPDTATPAP